MYRLPVFILPLVLLLQSGCATYARKSGNMHTHLNAGRIEQAAALAEKEDRSEKDVLASLNKGMLRRMQHNYRGSNAIFEKAKKRIDELYGVSITEQIGATTINDTLREFKGDRYEQVLVHAFMAMNYLELGQPDSARVEMLQADIKMREWGEQPEEDPFVRYLSGIVYEMLGEDDDAIIAYRKAVAVYQDAASRQPVDVPSQLREDLLRLLYRQGRDDEYQRLKREFGMTSYRPPAGSSGDVIIILNNGLAPVRSEHALHTFAKDIDDLVRIALPRYRGKKKTLNSARVQTGEVVETFDTVEDIDALARDALSDDMAVITTRAIARAVIKHKAYEKAKEKGGGAGVLAKLTALATERADTRSWTTLPQEIQLVRLSLPPGRHALDIEIVDPAQRVVDNVVREVDVKQRGLHVVSQHWVAPVPPKVAK